jgi:hypothetical protein
MSMHANIPPRKRPSAIGLRLLATGLAGVVVAVALASCGSGGKGLIPTADAGPLKGDFEAVAQAAQAGGGNCTATTEAINKTEQDFAALPSTIDPGLHSRIRDGISNLRGRALALCAQPLTPTATTTTPRTTTTTTKAQTTTPTPTTTTTTPAPTTPTTTTPPNNGGGTVAPGEGEREEDESGHGRGKGREKGDSGGVEPGGANPQEGGK